MKKTILFSTVLAAAVANADIISNGIGVLSVADASKNYLLVAVPWNDFGTGSSAVKVDTLVNPDTLAIGDKLYIANGAVYDVYEVNSNYKWAPATQATINANGTISNGSVQSVADKTVSRGDAIWLYRQNPSNNINLVGQIATGTASVALVAGWNLVASPVAAELDITTISNVENGDEIRISNNSGTEKRWTRSGGSWTRKVGSDDDTTVPAGTGFWYKSKTVKTITL